MTFISYHALCYKEWLTLYQMISLSDTLTPFCIIGRHDRILVFWTVYDSFHFYTIPITRMNSRIFYISISRRRSETYIEYWTLFSRFSFFSERSPPLYIFYHARFRDAREYTLPY